MFHKTPLSVSRYQMIENKNTTNLTVTNARDNTGMA